MKKVHWFFICLSLFISAQTYAQAPKAFRYQTVVRDATSGDPIADQPVSLKISILKDASNGSAVYIETFTTSTNSFGLINLVVGQGTVISGDFSTIDWSTGNYYLQSEVDKTGGSDFQPSGVSQLMSVPYALYAETGNQGPPGEMGETGPQGPAGTGLTNRGSWITGTSYNPGDYVFDRSLTNPAINSMWILQGSASYVSNTQPYLDIANWIEFQAPKGDQGTSLTNRSSWVTGTTYNPCDYVSSRSTASAGINAIWFVKGSTSFQSNTLPYNDVAHWTELAGLPGPTGAAGATGATGPAGTSLTNRSTWASGTIYYPGDYVSDRSTASASVNAIWFLKGLTSYSNTLQPFQDPTKWTELIGPVGATGATGAAGATGSTGATGPAGTSLTNRGTWGSGTVYNPGDYVSSRSLLSASVNSVWFLKGTTTYSNTIQPFQDLTKWTELTGPAGPSGTTSWTDATGKVSTMSKVGIGTTNPIGMLAVQGNPAVIADTAVLFEVKDKLGNTVFAVYPDGVVVTVSDGAKGGRGGFAVGGRQPGKSVIENIMWVTPDSVRIYIKDDVLPVKGGRGGFAVGGRSPAKGLLNEYLRVTPDSVRVYITDDPVKGGRGGFAVGGRSPSKGPTNEFLRITPDSTRVYVNEIMNGKGGRGGFAVGGRSPAKGGYVKEYMNIYTDSVAEKIANKPRLLWYPNKEAFLSGKVLVESPDSVGTNSMSTGFQSKAIGDYSQALGYKARAYGNYSTAIGKEAESNTNAFAFGYKAKALQPDAFAMGSGAYATGDKSFAFGSVGIDSSGAVTGNTKALGAYAYAFGLGCIASGKGAFSFGANDTASGNFSYSAGYKTKASNWYATSMGGYTQATGLYATAIGFKSKATGLASTVMGMYSESNGVYSVALGYNVKSNGAYAVSLGANQTASGTYATALNGGNTASGTYATAMGSATTAAGLCSFALGNLSQTTAAGSYSISGGYQSSAAAAAAIAVGWQSQATGQYAASFNQASTASGQGAAAFNYSNTASGIYSFSIGQQTVASGRNAFSAGDFTTASVYSSFVIGQYNNSTGSATVWQAADPLFVAGNGSSAASLTNALILYKNGNLTIAGAYGTSSDLRLKENITPFSSATDCLDKINPVYYTFKDQSSHPAGRQIGFIAQEVKSVIPELVTEDAYGYLSVDYSKMTVVLLQAVKEQEKVIQQQKLENEELKNRLDKIEEKMNGLTSASAVK